jgi:hypothetical protein
MGEAHQRRGLLSSTFLGFPGKSRLSDRACLAPLLAKGLDRKKAGAFMLDRYSRKAVRPAENATPTKY